MMNRRNLLKALAALGVSGIVPVTVPEIVQIAEASLPDPVRVEDDLERYLAEIVLDKGGTRLPIYSLEQHMERDVIEVTTMEDEFRQYMLTDTVQHSFIAEGPYIRHSLDLDAEAKGKLILNHNASRWTFPIRLNEVRFTSWRSCFFGTVVGPVVGVVV